MAAHYPRFPCTPVDPADLGKIFAIRRGAAVLAGTVVRDPPRPAPGRLLHAFRGVLLPPEAYNDMHAAVYPSRRYRITHRRNGIRYRSLNLPGINGNDGACDEVSNSTACAVTSCSGDLHHLDVEHHLCIKTSTASNIKNRKNVILIITTYRLPNQPSFSSSFSSRSFSPSPQRGAAASASQQPAAGLHRAPVRGCLASNEGCGGLPGDGVPRFFCALRMSGGVAPATVQRHDDRGYNKIICPIYPLM